VTAAAPWRVAILTAIPSVAAGYAAIVRAAGHEPVCVIVPRSVSGGSGFLELAPEGMDVLFVETKRSLAPLLRAYAADLGLCTGYPWLVPEEALEAPRLGIVNGHPSLLPRYRGPFPLAWAVRNGEPEIGLTYHLMDASFDTGNVLAQARIALDDDETMETLIPKLEAASVELLPQALARLARGDRGEPQDGPGEYHSRFEEAYALLDTSGSAAATHRQVRAWSFVPGFAQAGPMVERGGERVRVVRTSLVEVAGAERIECADGPLWVVETAPAE
jgi:methionyl-tRNA formyltransferase